MVRLILPIFIIFVFLYAKAKKIEVYNTFTEGAKEGAKIIFFIFPFLVAICILMEVFTQSGLKSLVCDALSPVLNLVGVPKELFELVLLRPFSGSATTALFQDLISTYGADSYIVRCAGTIMGSSETVFYVTAVYFSKMKLKNLSIAIPIALVCSILGAILSCVLCRII